MRGFSRTCGAHKIDDDFRGVPGMRHCWRLSAVNKPRAFPGNITDHAVGGMGIYGSLVAVVAAGRARNNNRLCPGGTNFTTPSLFRRSSHTPFSECLLLVLAAQTHGLDECHLCRRRLALSLPGKKEVADGIYPPTFGLRAHRRSTVLACLREPPKEFLLWSSCLLVPLDLFLGCVCVVTEGLGFCGLEAFLEHFVARVHTRRSVGYWRSSRDSNLEGARIRGRPAGPCRFSSDCDGFAATPLEQTKLRIHA